MADLPLGSATVEIKASLKPLSDGLKAAKAETTSASAAMSGSFKSLGGAATEAGRKIDSVGIARFAAGAAAAVVAVRALASALRSTVAAGDQLRQLSGRFEALTGSAERADTLLKGVRDTAKEFGNLSSIGGLTTQFRIATEGIGATDAQVAQFTKSLLQLGAIGGSSISESVNSFRQLSQGLASGILRAEEFNSIIEGTPLVARALAQELAGGSLGALRALVLEGKVLSEDVFAAILRQSQDIDAQFQDLPVSLERSSAKLESALSGLLGDLDKAIGLSATLSSALETVADAANSARAGSVVDTLSPFGGPAAIPGVGPTQDQLGELYNNQSPGAFFKSGVKSKPPTRRPEPPLKTGGGERSPRQRFDDDAARIVDSITRQIESVSEQSQLAGVSDDRARAQLAATFDAARAEQELYVAAQKAGATVTAEQVAAIRALGDQLVSATVFLEDQRAAQDALANAERAATKAAEDQARAVETIGNAFTSALQQADSFKDGLQRVGLELLKLGIQGLFGAGPLGGLLGGGGFDLPDFPGISINAKGNAFSGGRVVPFARGGVIGGPTAFPMAGSRIGLMGEAGPEAIMPLARGPDGKLGVRSAGGAVINQSFDFRGATVDEVKFRRIAREESGRAVAGLSGARADTKAVLA